MVTPGSSSSSRGSLRVTLLLILAAFAVCLLCGRAQAQSAEAPPNGPAPPVDTRPLRPKPLRRDVELVQVRVTVTDSYNRLVTGLVQGDFTVSEGDVPQQIRHFSKEDGPISLGVILDLSNSMKDKIDAARDAVVEFLSSANPEDDFFVITFSDRPELLADSTRSVGSVREKLATAMPHGHTALLDAVYLGITKMRSAKHGRRALLIISDGGDNSSRYTEKELKKLVEESDVEIYAIGLFERLLKILIPPEERDGKRLLTAITEATGGRMIPLHSPAELPKIAASVSLELRSQYVLAYRPADPARDGKWRSIRIALTPTTGGQKLHVHAKKGYLAPEE